MKECKYKKVLNVTSSDVNYNGIVNEVCQYINFFDVISKIKKGVEYVVEIPLEFQQGFDNGEYWIMENFNTGKIWPSLMEVGKNGRNKIVTPLPVKKKTFLQGNPIKDITNSYQSIYIQQQLNNVIKLLEETLRGVERIENGQMDDRIARLKAGRNGFLRALFQKGEDRHPLALELAIDNINVAQNQIFETFRRRVNEFKGVPKTKLGIVLRGSMSPGRYVEKTVKEYNKIHHYYGLYLLATKMLAGAYVMSGDVEIAQEVFDTSISEIQNLDYSNLKTIEAILLDNSNFDKIYNIAVEAFIEEKERCLNDAKGYECLSLSISGDKLIEVTKSRKSTLTVYTLKKFMKALMTFCLRKKAVFKRY